MAKTDKDEIRLAEAMGLRYDEQGPTPLFRYTMWWSSDRTVLTRNLKFFPHTDANDDYAVLEWMRKKKEDLGVQDFAFSWRKFAKSLKHACCYKIGDYARAALKILEADK